MIEVFSNAFFDEVLKIAEELTLDTGTPRFMAGLPSEGEPQSSSEPEGTAGEMASSENRRRLSELLETTEGRKEIRDRLESLRSDANRLIDHRKSYTRGLIRAHRSIYGPSPTPRKDLRDLLYGDEPRWTARFAR